MSSAKWRPFCLGLNVLKAHQQGTKSLKYYVFGKIFMIVYGKYSWEIL